MCNISYSTCLIYETQYDLHNKPEWDVSYGRYSYCRIKNAAMTVNILALGNSTRYAPNTPEIAPDAPIAGISPPPADTATRLCARAAAIPHPIYMRRYFTRPNLSSILSPN